jgi:hypothetical protein
VSSVSLSSVRSKWFAACNLVINLDRTKIIGFVTNNSPQSAFGIGYKENYVKDTVNKKIPCFTENNQARCKIIGD